MRTDNRVKLPNDGRPTKPCARCGGAERAECRAYCHQCAAAMATAKARAKKGGLWPGSTTS